MQPDFWRGKSVFLTGHTGFKGAWLSLWLASMGARVTGFALPPPTEPSLFETARVHEHIASIEGDIREPGPLKQALDQARPDIVIHMAAQALVRYSYHHPVETYAANVMGTVHLLEAVRLNGRVQATLVVTSDKCYENREQIWGYREGDPMGGHDPYSNSKGCAELVTQAYGKSYFGYDMQKGALVSARAGNVIGGGDWALDRLVPDIIRALLQNRQPVLRNPNSVRPWQHVLEPLSGYLRAIEYMTEGRHASPDAWNFAPDPSSHVTVGRLAESLCAAWGTGITPLIEDNPANVHEAHLLALDATKARQELGWTPRWNFRETVRRTAEWYRALGDQQNMQVFSLAQIRDYMHHSTSFDGSVLDLLIEPKLITQIHSD